MGRLDSALQASTFYNLDIHWSIRLVGLEEIAQFETSTTKSVIQRNQWCWPSLADADIIDIVSQLPPIHATAADTISWRSSSGKYSFQAAVSLIQPTTPRVFWHGLLQGKFKIPRHGFILWLAILEKLSTMDKPWVPSAENGCVLCGGLFDETHEHLFFKCWYSKRCLTILKRKIKFQWPYIDWQRGLMWASKRWRGNHLINAAFRATLAALVYHLWVERNNRKFSATSASAEYITSRRPRQGMVEPPWLEQTSFTGRVCPATDLCLQLLTAVSLLTRVLYTRPATDPPCHSYDAPTLRHLLCCL
ncbi:hypothetical protein Sango_3063900 [Sesamum angolense]|uniref:Reverse transcriptase zinc-binding domain-containing protein n=1 Tax=Sesamum angolense TaxID=2727404 RepID=A0AAE1T9B0_9LAMI|nr:hypothetical protein Sango_3063900 [Sesamum angolense]